MASTPLPDGPASRLQTGELVFEACEADGEIAIARDSGCYPHFVVNDCLETTIAEVIAIIRRESGTV